MKQIYQYKGSKATKYGNGMKKQKIFHCDSNGLSPRVFVNKDDPNYRPTYGSRYTQRQIDILNGVLAIDEVRLNELSILYRKADQLGDTENYERALMLYTMKKYPDTYAPQYTQEEAMDILQQLTPWEIDWNDHID